MSSLLELIGQFVAVLVAAAFMHFGAMLTDAVDKDTTSAAPAAKAGKATETQATTETKTSTETQTTVTSLTDDTATDTEKSRTETTAKS